MGYLSCVKIWYIKIWGLFFNVSNYSEIYMWDNKHLKIVFNAHEFYNRKPKIDKTWNAYNILLYLFAHNGLIGSDITY